MRNKEGKREEKGKRRTVRNLECKMKLGFDTVGCRHALGGVYHELSPGRPLLP